MSFVCNENIQIAYEKSDEVMNNIQYEPDKMIDSTAVIEYVKEHYCPKIELYTRSFAGLQYSSASYDDCGAMMRVNNQGETLSATIVLNSDMPVTFQRYALMQQIGHLITLPPDVRLNPDTYNVSKHIYYDLSQITEEDLENNYYLMREQVANIFALRVLMPNRQFYQKMRQLGSVSAVAQFFGLTEDAVISRMMIGA